MIIILLCYFVFLKDVNGLIKISNYLVPILIIFIAFISLKNVNITENYNQIINMGEVIKHNQLQAIAKSILYACYNCIILIPVLIPLRKRINGNKNAILISVMNFGLVTLLSYAIYNLLLQGNVKIFNMEMPIIAVVKNYGNIYQNIYIIIIGISIFTSAISAGCGFLNNCSTNTKVYKRNSMLINITALFLSQISFSTMVNLLYPVLGIFGVIEIFLILKNGCYLRVH